MKALQYLRSNEWTMGNGQCPECHGHKPRMGWWTETVGHVPKCKLAEVIEELSGKVTWERPNNSKGRRKVNKLSKYIQLKLKSGQA